LHPAARRSWGRVAALAAALALTGCGNGPVTPPDEGVLTLRFVPTSPAVSPLALSSSRLTIENLTLLGDVAPDGRSMLSELTIDLLSSGVSFMFTMLPQGLYSRVRFSVDKVVLEGSWRGVPLHVQLEVDNAPIVDLRSAAGVEVGPAQDVLLAIRIDGASWFAGNLLDTAVVASGEIVIDSGNNLTIGEQLLARVAASFSLDDHPAL
jgi:hypothetical protein